jgi:hypothetical protein
MISRGNFDDQAIRAYGVNPGVRTMVDVVGAVFQQIGSAVPSNHRSSTDQGAVFRARCGDELISCAYCYTRET